MTGALPRRSLLAMLGMAPIAATTAPNASGRSSSFGLGSFDLRSMTYGEITGLDVQGTGAFTSALRPPLPTASDRARSCLQAEARAQAALTTVFPPEIAAFRSFAPHVRRRLYAELLVREAEGLMRAGYTPPTPQASPGPGA